MEYKELSTLYHMDSSSEREANSKRLLEERRSDPSAFDLGFEISSGRLFMTVPRELSIINQKVLRRERKVSKLLQELPGIAQYEVLRSLVFDEVVMSNAIENIHSTRRQIEEALRETKSEDLKSKRFREFAKLYLDLVDGDYAVPESPEDIREIYDKVMTGENIVEAPDGRLFRREGVSVVDGVNELHAGITPEEEIITAMETTISLAGNQDVPELYSALATHFIFEYAHPFYDGNGRTGRYLLSMYLEAPLSKPTALSLSRVIAENRPQYYQAFQSAEDPLNRGELTFFIIAMHQLIIKAQEQLIARLERNIETMGKIDEFSHSLDDEDAYSGKEGLIIYAMLLQSAFGVSGEVRLDDISRFIGVGSQQTRKYMKGLERKGIVRLTRKRDPLLFELSDEFIKKINLALG